MQLLARPRIDGPYSARDGEICVVCNSKLSTSDFAFVVEGRRVGVMRGMEQTFLADPMRYLRSSPQTAGSPPASPWTPWLLLLAGLLALAVYARMAIVRRRARTAPQRG